MVLALLAIPVFLYLVVCYLIHSGRLPATSHQAWWAAVLVAAVIGTAPALWWLARTSHWQGGTEIAWTGLETVAPTDELVIGGARDQATVGWPSGAFAPEIRLASEGGGFARLAISRGSAFVRNAEGKFLNGRAVSDGPPQTFGEMRVRTYRKYVLFGRRLAITRQDGTPLADIPVRRKRSKDRVLPLEVLVTTDAVRLRQEGQAQQAAELENWASRFRLLIARSGELRLLDQKDPPFRHNVQLPCDLRILWPNLTLPVSFRRTTDQQRLRVAFLPPLRLASPLPPPANPGDQDIRLTVTGRALPGDTAFLLPLGGDLAHFRETLPMPEGRFPTAGASAPDIPIWQRGTAQPARPDLEEVTSQRTVRVEAATARVSYYAHLATLRDLPQLWRIWIGFAVALIPLGFGLWLAKKTLRPLDGWALGGLITAVWSLLAYRCVLAYRFALDPTRLDPLAVSGMSTALVALAVIPGVILLAARLHRDWVMTFRRREEILAGFGLLGLLAAVVAFGFVESALAASLWPNARAYAGSLGLLETAALALVLLFLVGYIFFHYLLNLDVLGLPEPVYEKLSAVRYAFESLLDSAGVIVTRVGRWIWMRVCWPLNATFVPEPGDGFWWIFVGLLVAEACILFAVFLLVSLVPSGNKLLQEVLVPLAFCWVPAFIWLASRLRLPAGGLVGGIRWDRALALAVGMVLIPVFVLPLAVRDAGGVVATLAVFLPTALVLVMGRAPRRIGFLASATLAVALLGGWFGYLNLRPLLPQLTKVGELGTRLLVFDEDSALMRFLVYFPLTRDTAEDTPTFQSLSSGLQHTWENRALVHEGGWWGLGFGEAPTTRSPIRQDTLQFDSTFSFFIASENGLPAGLLLLLLYAVPLVMVLWSGRAHFDIGHAVATVIASAFFLEALAHVLMNLAALPFTGRSLPLLAVNSTSDFFKWIILFWVAAQALQWRATGDPVGYQDVSSVLSGVRQADGRAWRPERPWHFWRGAAVLTTVLLAGFVWAGVQGARIVRNPAFANAFDWSDLLGTVKLLADGKMLTVNQTDKTIELAPSVAPDAGSLLQQEIARFNALSESERLEGAAPEVPVDFQKRLRSLKNLADYDGLLADLRQRDSEVSGVRRPMLFQLATVVAETDDRDQPEFRVEANPAFNTKVSFRTARNPSDFPSVSLSGGAAGAYLVRGPGFEFSVPDRPAEAADPWRRLYLEESAGGVLRATEEPGPETPRLRVIAKLRLPGATATQVQHLGDFESTREGLTFVAGRLRVELRPATGAAARALTASERVTLKSADLITAADARYPGFRLSLRVHRIARGAIIGPAWSRGSWDLAFNPDPVVPWTSLYLAALRSEWRRLGRDEAAKRYGTLTLDQKLQAAAAQFAAERGRRHYGEVLAAFGGRRRTFLPPRVALAVVRLPGGEVLGLGGWPRMTSDRHWHATPEGEILPPVTWVEERAPHSLRTRYRGDRNFDRIVVGSASKPLWATAALAVHRDLDRVLSVTGAAGEESDVFGIQITPPWHVGASASLSGGKWSDFRSYLARSDNRYQVRLGFLGLALSGPGGPVGTSTSQSDRESLDGGNTEWRRFPQFPDHIVFSHWQPATMRSLDRTDLADHLHRMYSIGTSSRPGPDQAPGPGSLEDYRLSFWSGNEAHDRAEAVAEGIEGAPEPRPTSLFRTISPETPVFALDQITSPREYITLLLGGGSNLWSNVDLAGAFGTCVLGRPVVVHASRVAPHPDARRERFEDLARRLYPGLTGAVEAPGGTANGILSANGALAWIRQLRNVQAYAKTGTLALGPEGTPRQVSRMLLALVRRAAGGEPEGGLVFSLVAESAEMGTATRWLGEFLLSARQDIQRLLYSQ